MRVGVDYYPEHWPEDRLPVDVEMMRKAGVRIVRMAEFAWSRMEPLEAEYRFEWLESAHNAMHAAGIQAVLGTPTAAPPAWLHQRYPEIYPRDEWRRPLGFGTRLQRCLNNPQMREHSRRITEAMAQRFSAHPAVEAWQTDNEFTSNHCFCDHCADEFRHWLQRKHGTLESLNRAWGTVFWSQEYTAWEQVPLPWAAKCGLAHNPSLRLEYRRFQSDSAVGFQREQVTILRSLCPGLLITHNLMGLHDSMDYFALSRDLDLVTWDNYPITPWGEAGLRSPLGHDVMRGIKERNFWVMEEQCGITGWDTMSPQPCPGEVRAWAWQAVSHGADTIVFFRWRSCRHGTEQYWHGVIGHDGVPRRRYREVSRLASEFERLSPVVDGSQVRAEVAILQDYDQHYAFQVQPQAEGLGVWDQALRFYRPLWERGVDVDVVCPLSDLGRYKVLIAPALYVLTEEVAARLRRYVQEGGILVLNPRTGVKNSDNVCVEEPLPGMLSDVAGVTVDDYNPLGGRHQTVTVDEESLFGVSIWADALIPDTAEVWARYKESPYAGEPAITINRFGRGTAWYFGTVGEPALYEHLLPRILQEAGARMGTDVHEDVGIRTRVKDGKRIVIAVNLGAEERTVAVPAHFEKVLGDPASSGGRISAFDVAVYVET